MKSFNSHPGEGTTVLTTILAVLLAVCAAFTAYSLPAQSILFQPEPMLKALESNSFSERLPKFLVNVWMAGSSFGLLSDLPAGQTQTLANAVLPAQYTHMQTTVVISYLYQYLNLRVTRLSLPVDLRPVREKMQMEETAQVLVDSWPSCSADQLLAVISGDNLPVCQPTELLKPIAVQLTRAALSQTAKLLPDQVDFAEVIDASLNDQARSVLDRTFTMYRLTRMAFLSAPWFGLAFLLAIVLLNWHYPQQLFSSLGAAFFFAGITAGIIGLMLLSGVDKLAVTQITWNGPTGGKDLLEALLLSVRLVLHNWILASLGASAAMILAGGLSGVFSGRIRL